VRLNVSEAHYTAATHERRATLLRGLGAAVRARRAERRLTMKQLGELARVSERFLTHLEAGEGNISVARLEDVAEALGTTAAELLAAARAPVARNGNGAHAPPVVALLGLRGAGKSAIGARLAKRLRVPFVEFDAVVAREAGMSLGTIFEMHGEAYFHRLERAALTRLLAEARGRGLVLATGGSIVTDEETFALLRGKATTLWLKARPRDHWDRVVALGDVRPMRDRANAMSELKALLAAREHLYAKAAHAVDTSAVALDEAVERAVQALGADKKAKAPARSKAPKATKTARNREVRS
jgi:XRE family aerobic/anaerobic benzoate catabolism transcriptional regulator